MMAVIVVVFVAVAAAVGWWWMNKNGVKPLTDAEKAAQATGAKKPPGSVGDAGAGVPVKAQN